MFLYLPNACATRNSGCEVQFVFHGCAQSIMKVGDLFAKRSGFLEWAASNKIIVVFPQTGNQKEGYCWEIQEATHYNNPWVNAIYYMMEDLQRSEIEPFFNFQHKTMCFVGAIIFVYGFITIVKKLTAPGKEDSEDDVKEEEGGEELYLKNHVQDSLI